MLSSPAETFKVREVRAPGYETLTFDVIILEYQTTVYKNVLTRN